VRAVSAPSRSAMSDIAATLTGRRPRFVVKHRCWMILAFGQGSEGSLRRPLSILGIDSTIFESEILDMTKSFDYYENRF
jgi:hypothetical protein